MKYDFKDFEKVIDGNVTLDELVKKYGVSRKTIIRTMNNNGFYLNKTKIKIISPYKTKIVYSWSSCASELNVSVETVRQAIRGKKIKLFEKMGIRLEVVKNGTDN